MFHHPGDWVFVACDQAGLQDRCFSHYLAEIDGGAYGRSFIAGADTHWASAIALELIPPNTERDKTSRLHVALREGSKSFRYGFLFGMRGKRAGEIVATIIRAARAVDPSYKGPTTNGAQALHRFEAATPGLKQLRESLEAQAARNAWVLGLDGRRVPTGAQYKALNRIVTSAEAIVCKRWLINVHDELCTRFRYGWSGDVVITAWIHDELVACCRPEVAKEVGEIMVRYAKEAGEFYSLKIPLDAEYTVGRNWAGETIDAQPTAQTYHDEINDGLKREGIAPINWEALQGVSDARCVVGDARRKTNTGVSHGNGPHHQVHCEDPARLAVASEVSRTPGNGIDPAPNQRTDLERQTAAASASSYTHRTHGDNGPKQGRSIATWIYAHPNQPNYLRVDKHISASGERRFYQHHWNGSKWVYGVKNTYAETKIPYRLPELLTAAPDTPIFVCEGEKDTDNVAALGLIATTNPGGAKVFQPELAQWFKGKELVYILEDNDEAGRGHTGKILAALAGIVPTIAVVAFPELAEKGDVSDWLAQGGNKNLLLARAEQARNHNKTQEIIEPIDLWGRFDPPVLPQGLLPETIERFAIEEAELMGVDLGGLAMAALAVCAAALPDHTQLQVKRHDPNWLEAARLWVGLIGNPSTKKTPVILRATKPLKRIDTELWRSYVITTECYEQLSKEERKTVERPKQRRLRLEDTTIEAAQEVLKDSPDGVLCIQDELAGWFGAMDKYAGRGAAKDRGFWLQSFHGGPYALNRIARGAAMIENLSVSLLGGIQPDPIRKIAAETVDDGLLQRLIPIVLRRGSAGQDTPHGGQDYDELITRLHDRPPPSGPLQFTDAALTIRQELEQKHLDLMAYEIINRKLAAHIGKYDGLFARFCLLWHCIEGAEGSAVSEHTARRVADFMRRFLLPHATAFYADMLELSDDHDRLTRVAGYILARKLSHITNRDVQRGSRAMRGLQRLEIESIFEQLEALGWLIRAPGPYRATPLHWQVNPVVHRRFAERAEREAKERTKEREMLQEMFRGGKQ